MNRQCGACGKPLPPDANPRRIYCSEHCKRRATTRKALLRGDVTDPAKAAEIRAEMEAALAGISARAGESP